MKHDSGYWQKKLDELKDKIATSSEYQYWSSRCLLAIGKLPPGTYTGEGLRVAIVGEAGNPTHHNHWGIMIREAAKQGYIVRTGRYEHMQLPQSHGRESPVWQVVQA